MLYIGVDLGTSSYIRTYLSLCMRYKTNIYVGSDAHDPSFIGEFSCAERPLEVEKKQGQLPLWL